MDYLPPPLTATHALTVLPCFLSCRLYPILPFAGSKVLQSVVRWFPFTSENFRWYLDDVF